MPLFFYRQCSDLMLKVDERLLAYREESTPRSIKIDHKGDDCTKDEDERDGSKRTAPPAQTRAKTHHG